MNIYSEPEKFGFETLGDVNFSDSYEFDIILVLTRRGQVYYAQDSGCSCPIPFEYTTEESLTLIENSWDFKKFLEEYRLEHHYTTQDSEVEIAELYVKVHEFIMNALTINDGKANPVMK